MKNKIKQFSKGEFKVEQPDIRFSTTHIHMSVGEGEVYEGSFLIENVKDGDIILLHDIHTETIDAAIKLIPMLQEEGYQLVTVSELAGAKGIKMEKGAKYTDF